MEKITTIGLDIAKHVFQVHGINGAGVARRSAQEGNRRPVRDIAQPRRQRPTSNSPPRI